MEISGMSLMLFLGLRHGFDPDHIAIIDGVGVRLAQSNSRIAKWTGTLFAIGHGSIVTSVAVMISMFSHSWEFPKQVWEILDWIPGLVLILVGFLNLRMLLRSSDYKPKGLKIMFLPKRLRESSNPMGIIIMGAVFAMVFDTNTQAAAWAYTATTRLSVISALLLGLSFSIGMIITDTLDSRILYLLLKRSTDQAEAFNYRRKLGWIIVVLSIVVGSYKLISVAQPQLALAENILTILGIAFFSVMAIFYSIIYYSKPLENK